MCRNVDVFAKTPVGVYAQHAHIEAAVGLAQPARLTSAAVQVRLHRTPVAGPHIRNAFTHGHHLGIQLMAQHAGIREKRLPAPVGVVVGAAHPHAVDAQPNLPNAGWRQRRAGGVLQLAGLAQGEDAHFWVSQEGVFESRFGLFERYCFSHPQLFLHPKIAFRMRVMKVAAEF